MLYTLGPLIGTGMSRGLLESDSQERGSAAEEGPRCPLRSLVKLYQGILAVSLLASHA